MMTGAVYAYASPAIDHGMLCYVYALEGKATPICLFLVQSQTPPRSATPVTQPVRDVQTTGRTRNAARERSCCYSTLPCCDHLTSDKVGSAASVGRAFAMNDNILRVA
jgi:hypothetical protein